MISSSTISSICAYCNRKTSNKVQTYAEYAAKTVRKAARNDTGTQNKLGNDVNEKRRHIIVLKLVDSKNSLIDSNKCLSYSTLWMTSY